MKKIHERSSGKALADRQLYKLGEITHKFFQVWWKATLQTKKMAAETSTGVEVKERW